MAWRSCDVELVLNYFVRDFQLAGVYREDKGPNHRPVYGVHAYLGNHQSEIGANVTKSWKLFAACNHSFGNIVEQSNCGWAEVIHISMRRSFDNMLEQCNSTYIHWRNNKGAV